MPFKSAALSPSHPSTKSYHQRELKHVPAASRPAVWTPIPARPREKHRKTLAVTLPHLPTCNTDLLPWVLPWNALPVPHPRKRRSLHLPAAAAAHQHHMEWSGIHCPWCRGRCCTSPPRGVCGAWVPWFMKGGGGWLLDLCGASACNVLLASVSCWGKKTSFW